MKATEILCYAHNLSIKDRKELIKQFIDMLNIPLPHHSVIELDGLGKEIWQQVDVEASINELRDEWDHPS